jgi:hypothetical protein
VIAYRQPVTRAEIEHIRGVDAGAVLRSLLDRQLVRIAGHREVPGRPIVYATSRRFLEVFGLAKLGDLPTLRSIEALPEQLNADAPAVESAPPIADDPRTTSTTISSSRRSSRMSACRRFTSAQNPRQFAVRASESAGLEITRDSVSISLKSLHFSM